LLRDVTATLCTWLELAEPPVGSVANCAQVLPESPDQKALTTEPLALSTPVAAM
jgi:hypothetical protein